MGDGSDQRGMTGAVYATGDILVWRIRENTAEEAERAWIDMGALADEHGLGEWGGGPVGSGTGAAWFDLTLSRSTDIFLIMLLFGSKPDVY